MSERRLLLDRSNFSSSSSSTPNQRLKVDWKLECDLTYGTYLQALMIQKLTKETIERHKTVASDQLSLQADILERQNTRKCTLEEEIERLELESKLKNVLEKLRILLDSAGNNAGNNKTKRRLNSMIKDAESACDELYLKQVTPLESPQDYQKFEKLSDRCLKSLQKVNTICGDVDSIQQLADCLSRYKRLCSEIAEVQNSLVNLQEQVQSNALDHVSEKFAAYRGYD